MKVDASKGEWRCQCPQSDTCDTYDTSVNPKFVAACGRCGASRPVSRPVQYSERIDAIVYDAIDAPMSRADWIALALAALDQAGLNQAHQNDVTAILSHAPELDE